ncbi:unnamed protein product [Musa acuminata subsp. malaccensis]|nr:PREDICTED: protein NLP3-like isoform X2 [Musa acuminata subsp. malaccensis]XP_009412370.1 PREDICTED: protein NLP3-like isoform X2 [Musa acuminata subsp. malaccensis]XP_018685690.1 PREDICTED: protein NLP3-like isoform X2 [Musa acuminata subsp. malaccensis]CAG1830540.1 unnamed protein product [Musa acuminata subsp. malaccensis]
MSEPRCHSPRPSASPALMDLDLDVSPWTFDPSPLVASLPSSFLLSSSSPLFFPPPPSPLWIFEDTAAVVSSSLADDPGFLKGNHDMRNAKANMADSKAMELQVPAVEEFSDGSFVIKERMTQALRYFKESTDHHVLVQVWAPVKNGDRCVLTTLGQPFILDPESTKLLQYRTVSLMYIFSVDEDDDADLGLPGRVFTRRMPEWTPNVQYYSSKEYQRLNHALCYNVQGTLALPVFEPSGQSCIGVVEVVMTSQKVNYAYEVDKVCKALEAVNLKSSEILDHPNVLIANDGHQAALAEILEILTLVCEAKKLPLAQTWVPCRHQTVLTHGGGPKKICSRFDGSCMGQVCMSTTDVAFYIIDPHLWGFREACVEHHLQKGQGVAGKTFAQRRPCFSKDITKYCKSEYPLVHYARMFGLAGCLAICLRSNHLGDDDYILEFFLPADCKSPGEQQDLLNSISGLLKQCFQNLKFITEVKFQGGKSPEVDLIADGSYELRPRLIYSPRGDTHVHIPSEANIDEPVDNDDSLNEENATPDLHGQHLATDSNVKKNGNKLLDSTALDNKTSYIPAKRRGKPEKTISLELLQQYFSGNLKDAAKSLGVCPTTMKRICRHHGISRWPSRKINKVNRSLSKLKHVIESVQGAGSLDLTSLSCPLPVAVDSVPWPVDLDSLKDLQDGVKRSEFCEFSPEIPCDREDQQDQPVSLRVHVKEQVDPQLNPVMDSRRSTGSSSEGSMDAPTSQGSCQGSPVNNFFVSSQPALSDLNQAQGTNCSSKLTLQNACYWSLLNENSLPVAVNSKPQLPVGVLIKDSGSSKELKINCTFAGVGSRDEPAMILTRDTSQPWVSQETKALTIKASYKEDIIRFRLPHNAGILALKDEISKKLKLEVGTFDIKYLDDDHEWVMLTCDWDLEECLDVSRSSGAHIIRLSVHDTVTNLGSSCESSEVDYHNYVTRQFNVG